MPELPDYPRFQVADDWVPILVERGVIYAEMGRFDDAKQDADRISHITVDGAVGLNAQCLVRGAAGKDMEQGLDACNRSVDRKPHVAETYELRGTIYFKLGRYRQALADFDAALDRKSSLDGSRFARGVTKLRLGDTKGGNADIEDANARSASIAQSLAGMGIAP
ncbi:MAG: tetratricopeptide repeat protein [Alphaproteobacteria bacterium]|nr:tetratricopeptide repeat protein [Alphaproteobacteria bacterium]